MIQHIGEVLAVLTVAFVVGSVIGWIAYRWIDRTDYSFDQRDLADKIGRLLGIRTPAPVEEPASAAATAAFVPVTAARPRPVPLETSESRPEPARRSEPVMRAEPVVLLPGDDEEPFRFEPAAKSEAAEDLRKRVQSSTRALAWREARDERLRPGEAAAQVVAGANGLTDDAASPETAVGKTEEPKTNGKSPASAPDAAAAPPRKGEPAADSDEPWAASPEVWPVDLRRLPAPDSGSAPLALPALPAPVSSEIRLSLPPVVATAPLAADDIWSDDEESSAPDDIAAVPPPPAEDRPPALEGGPPAERDNLRRIKGIGQGFEKRLNQLGIYRYAQIAGWTERNQAWVSAELGFPGRVERDNWPAQASRLGRSLEGRAVSEAQIVRDP